LPQLVFNPRFTNYFPGPNFWHAKESCDAPKHRETSGVVQPPVHATAALCVYRHAEDETRAKEFLKYSFSKRARPGTITATGSAIPGEKG
jgi:hypothetical protein